MRMRSTQAAPGASVDGSATRSTAPARNRRSEIVDNLGLARSARIARERKVAADHPAVDGQAGFAQGVAERGTSGTGAELPHRASIQSSFGRHDVSSARAHVGGGAAEAADRLAAAAYTVGDRIAFAEAPTLRVAAHEAAHVVQQRAGISSPGESLERHADAVADRVAAGVSSEALLDRVASPGAASKGASRIVQRLPKFAPMYGSNAAADAQSYKDTIGTAEDPHDKQYAPDRPGLRPASQWDKGKKTTGTKVAAFRMSSSEILEVISAAESAIGVDTILGPRGSSSRTTHEAQIAGYVAKMTEAFEIMEIDTIEAQADFVAHSVGETLLSKLTEAQTTTFEDDPTKVSVSTSLMTDAGDPMGTTGTILGPRRYMGNRLIDPLGKITQSGAMAPSSFRETFIGRGPIQVTDRTNYLHALMYLDLRADELQRTIDAMPANDPHRAQLVSQVALLREAVQKIGADPSLAADPKYAFLFSAAFMQSSSALRTSIAGFGETHDFTKSAGFSGGFIDDRAKVKTKAYAKAYAILASHLTPKEYVDAVFGDRMPPLEPSPWSTER